MIRLGKLMKTMAYDPKIIAVCRRVFLIRVRMVIEGAYCRTELVVELGADTSSMLLAS